MQQFSPQAVSGEELKGLLFHCSILARAVACFTFACSPPFLPRFLFLRHFDFCVCFNDKPHCVAWSLSSFRVDFLQWQPRKRKWRRLCYHLFLRKRWHKTVAARLFMSVTLQTTPSPPTHKILGGRQIKYLPDHWILSRFEHAQRHATWLGVGNCWFYTVVFESSRVPCISL